MNLNKIAQSYTDNGCSSFSIALSFDSPCHYLSISSMDAHLRWNNPMILNKSAEMGLWLVHSRFILTYPATVNALFIAFKRLIKNTLQPTKKIDSVCFELNSVCVFVYFYLCANLIDRCLKSPILNHFQFQLYFVWHQSNCK